MKGLLILGVSSMLFVGRAKADDLWLMAVKTPPPALSPRPFRRIRRPTISVAIGGRDG
jgi:hypothetical protein